VGGIVDFGAGGHSAIYKCFGVFVVVGGSVFGFVAGFIRVFVDKVYISH
jgi:hypothetical protein